MCKNEWNIFYIDPNKYHVINLSHDNKEKKFEIGRNKYKIFFSFEMFIFPVKYT